MPEFDDIERRRKKTKSSYTDIKKHYVRMDGWLPVFRRYSELRGKALRYLTLCAKYAIDVRYFRQKGVLPYDEKQKIYPTLTFIEKDAQDYAIIAESLGTTKLGIRGDLEDILVNPARNTENARKLTLSFPYDIINLDFTGEVVREDDPPYSQTIRAIERIIDLQNGANCPAWHMFLTFRACQQTSNHEADGELRTIIQDNLQNAAALAAYGVRLQPGQLIGQQYEEFLRIGITKFLASGSCNRGYACALESSYIYPRNPGRGDPRYYIVKLIVEFRAIRGARNLLNPLRARAAYENSVPQIFGSRPINVNAQINRPATRQALINDLRPVLEELERQQIVD